MTRTIIRSVLPVGARGCLQRYAVAVEKDILHSHPEEMIPCLLLRIRQIDYWFGWLVRDLTLALDMLIEERNRGSHPLRQIRPRIGQHPNVTQTIIFRVAVVQGVAHDTNQRHLGG